MYRLTRKGYLKIADPANDSQTQAGMAACTIMDAINFLVAVADRQGQGAEQALQNLYRLEEKAKGLH